MNTRVLKAAEKKFLREYPGGFTHPDMVALGKKHKMPQLEAFAKESFAKKSFDDRKLVVNNMVKLVSRSTMVSMFEKPKFKSAITPRTGGPMVDALCELLHGKPKVGFEALVDALQQRKLAKWPLATVFQLYYRPRTEVFIKPTTAKLIIDKLDLDLTYHSTPTWAFYRDFRKAIKTARGQVSKTLAPDNAAFCGFLMMALRD